MIKFYQIYCSVLFGVMYIPVLGLLMLNVACPDKTCWSIYTSTAVICLVAIIVLIGFSVVFKACVLDRNPSSSVQGVKLVDS
jgi:hypothetical protein